MGRTIFSSSWNAWICAAEDRNLTCSRVEMIIFPVIDYSFKKKKKRSSTFSRRPTQTWCENAFSFCIYEIALVLFSSYANPPVTAISHTSTLRPPWCDRFRHPQHPNSYLESILWWNSLNPLEAAAPGSGRAVLVSRKGLKADSGDIYSSQSLCDWEDETRLAVCWPRAIGKGSATWQSPFVSH